VKLSFIGLGIQGKYLAINLAEAGHDLLAYDLRADALAEVVARGARAAKSCREAGAHGEIICVCVLDDEQLRTAVLGEDGVLAGARPGSIIAVHSTVEPGTIAALATAAREKGIELIDAPVSGSEPGARNKTMAHMVGGSAEAFARCQPVFAVSGPNVIHTGPLGTGIRAKLAHQIMVCLNMLSAYEGMKLGVEAGVAPEVLAKVMNAGSAQSKIADRWFQRRLHAQAREVFYKDLRLCIKFAHELKLPVPGAALAQQLLDRIVILENAK
jgi:3-hydroxyisobutyrate dehydrogenase-like beta-hydroxyacid dehydrogenase